MNAARLALGLAVMVAAERNICLADMTAGPWPSARRGVCHTIDSKASTDTSSSVSLSDVSTDVAVLVDGFGVLRGTFGSDAYIDDVGAELAGEYGECVRQLPATPGSAVLFLCGLSGLGAFQLTRSTGRLQFGDVPAWIHCAGPHQVGHAHALYPECINTASLCWIDPGTGSDVIGSENARREPRLRRYALCFPTVSAPRAPPALAVSGGVV